MENEKNDQAFGLLRVGTIYKSSSLVIDRERMLAFAREFDPQPFHLVDEGSLLGSIAASGWYTAALTQSLMIRDGLPLVEGMIGLSVELKWPNVARPGDIVRVESRLQEIRPSRSKPGRAIATIYSETLSNQNVVLQQQTAIVMISRGSDTCNHESLRR